MPAINVHRTAAALNAQPAERGGIFGQLQWRPAVQMLNRKGDCRHPLRPLFRHFNVLPSILYGSPLLQGSQDPNSGETWMLKMSEWAPQSLGGALSAGQALKSKGEEVGGVGHSELAVPIETPCAILTEAGLYTWVVR